MPKRKNYIDWNTYFMNVAVLTSMRSKDPNTQVGSCIVNSDNIICGTGYNGFPKNCSDDYLSWNKSETDVLDNKHSFVIHSEVNAILNKNTQNINGCSLYTTHFPCNECTKIIIQSGIIKIFYLYEKKDLASEKMLDLVGIEYCKIKLLKKIKI